MNQPETRAADAAMTPLSEGDRYRQHIRLLVRNYYDDQTLRIQTGNRIVMSMRPELVAEPTEEPETDGQDPEDVADKADTARKKADRERNAVLKTLQREYRLVTDMYVSIAKQKKMSDPTGDGPVEPETVLDSTIRKALAKTPNLTCIKTELDYRMARNYEMLLRAEEDCKKAIAIEVQKHPLWNSYLKDVPGCGHLMAAVLISSIDIHAARHPSSLWRYAGLDVDENGRGRTRQALETVEYTDKNGNIRERKSLGYNPFLKTKLVGVLAASFLRCKESAESGFGLTYYNYRHRLECREDLRVTPRNVYAAAGGHVTAIHVQVGDRVSAKDPILTVQAANGRTYVSVAAADGIVTHLNVDVGDQVGNKAVVGRYEVNAPQKLHIHRMACRYAVKMFLLELWIHWRALEGYDTTKPSYAEAKLGMPPHGYNEADDRQAVAV